MIDNTLNKIGSTIKTLKEFSYEINKKWKTIPANTAFKVVSISPNKIVKIRLHDNVTTCLLPTEYMV